jgi:TfoX/Sxy family transcriptional regulator of competence genes
MTEDDPLTIRVRKALSGVRNVREKRMFGSTGFMVNGKLCVSARQSRIMCKVDPALQEDLLARRGCTLMKMKGRDYNGYVLVDSKALQTDKDLKFWVGLALDFNSTVRGNGV